ncbi:MAG: magnesium transporter [Acholeplasmataceae bacterium]|jgi:magnesium transporter|nr:magnesium transporter [Acholeplasmataceae bacterium]
MKLNFKHSDESLKKQFHKMHAFDLAELFPFFSDEDKKKALRLIDIDKKADMFVELDIDDQLELLSYFDLNEKKSLLRKLESDDLKEFISDIEDHELQKEMLGLLSKVRAKSIEYLMQYEDDLAASIMSTEYVTINIDMSIKEATNKVITTSKDSDYIDTIYVINHDDKVIGVVDLKDLIIARPSKELEAIINDDFQFVYEDDNIEKAIQTVRDYDRNAIPVLNHEDQIIGIITGDDIFDEMIESHEYDYQKMALLNDHESSSSSITRSKQRLPWLMIAVVLNLLIASFLSIFEATLAQVTALVLFQPLILGMAGNIGTQSLAVTILGFHLETFDDKKMPKQHVLKEVMIGLTNSAILGVLSFGFVYGFLTLIPTGSQSALSIANVVFIAVFSSMFISAAMGALVPIILKRFGSDPAVASGPIMTTINDLVALVIYFGVATLIFLT